MLNFMEKWGEIPFLIPVWICAAALQSFTQNRTKDFQENSLHCWCNELAKNTYVFTHVHTQAHINKQQQGWNLWVFLSCCFFSYGPFFKSLYWNCYNIPSVLCFVFLAPSHVGSQLPDKGWNLHLPPALEDKVLTTGTIREVPEISV